LNDALSLVRPDATRATWPSLLISTTYSACSACLGNADLGGAFVTSTRTGPCGGRVLAGCGDELAGGGDGVAAAAALKGASATIGASAKSCRHRALISRERRERGTAGCAGDDDLKGSGVLAQGFFVGLFRIASAETARQRRGISARAFFIHAVAFGL
jgi:hypothetical protein